MANFYSIVLFVAGLFKHCAWDIKSHSIRSADQSAGLELSRTVTGSYRVSPPLNYRT